MMECSCLSVIIHAAVLCLVVNAYNPGQFGGHGGGAPGGMMAPGGAPPDPSPDDSYRPISPGDREEDPEGNKREGAWHNPARSPQQDVDDQPTTDIGVQDDDPPPPVPEDDDPPPPVGEDDDSLPPLPDDEVNWETPDGTIELEFGIGAAEMAAPAGCGPPSMETETQTACPLSSVQAMWNVPSSDEMGLIIDGYHYKTRVGENIMVGDKKFKSKMHKGSLCKTIDAAFTAYLNLKEGSGVYTVFFSGDQYSLYKESSDIVYGPFGINEDYDTPLDLALPLYAKKVDAAMTWKGDVYLFFRYNNKVGYFSKYVTSRGYMAEHYPRPTEHWWNGLPTVGPDAAYSPTGSSEIHFVVGDDYYVYDDTTESVKDPVPKSVFLELYKCDDF